MKVTVFPEADSSNDDIGKLRATVCKKLAKKKGAGSPEQMANMFGIHRSHMYRLLSGDRLASLPLAFRMSRQLGTKVQALFVDQENA